MTVEDWQALGREAAACLRAGNPQRAAELFARQTELRPDDADAWFNLAYSQRSARLYELALESYAQALVCGVERPEEVHLNRAVILSECLHRSAEAADELQAAIRLNPNAVSPWLNLGGLHEDLGEVDAARSAYTGVLELAPGNGRALARLAALDVHEGQPACAIAMLRDASTRAGDRTEDAAEIWFALGNALDAAGDYPQAFAAVREGNSVSMTMRPPQQRYDRTAHERLIGALLKLTPDKVAPREADFDHSPIFICGMFRSGSTLAEQLLSRHRDVTQGGELELIPAFVREELQPYPSALDQASVEQMERLRSDYLEQVKKLFPDARNVTDKRPDNFLHVALIKALFPAARIIHTVRQPLDNILSIYFLHFAASVSYSESLDDIAHFYAQYRRLMTHWQDRYGDDIISVDYDELVAQPERALKQLVSAIGLDWDPACLMETPPVGAVRTPSNWQVRSPLHQRSSGRWQNYRTELARVSDQLTKGGLLNPESDAAARRPGT